MDIPLLVDAANTGYGYSSSEDRGGLGVQRVYGYEPARLGVGCANVRGAPALLVGQVDVVGNDDGGCCCGDIHMVATQLVGWPEQLAWTLATYAIEAGWRVAKPRQRVSRGGYLKPRESCVG
jgi:hypothetical protein